MAVLLSDIAQGECSTSDGLDMGMGHLLSVVQEDIKSGFEEIDEEEARQVQRAAIAIEPPFKRMSVSITRSIKY